MHVDHMQGLPADIDGDVQDRALDPHRHRWSSGGCAVNLR
jgi:hypothetical protein